MRLGKRQKQIVDRMKSDNLVIRVVFDHYNNKEDINLEDEEGDNTYESISPKMLQSLCNKNLFTQSGWCPCLQITVDTFRLK